MYMERRKLLYTIAMVSLPGFLGGAPAARANRPVSGLNPDLVERMREDWREFLAADFSPPAPGDSFNRNDSEWREVLGERQYDVMREKGTEPKYHSPLNAESRTGLYLCAGCDLPLFSSEMKYDSGTGWPSFFTHIPDVFETELDLVLFIPRTEYHCVRCGSHHGHVFDDGPEPTGERWCNNGLALRFLPTT